MTVLVYPLNFKKLGQNLLKKYNCYGKPCRTQFKYI